LEGTVRKQNQPKMVDGHSGLWVHTTDANMLGLAPPVHVQPRPNRFDDNAKDRDCGMEGECACPDGKPITRTVIAIKSNTSAQE
jgi:hypothetical protein